MVTDLTPDFSAFLRSLAENSVDYLLIGGYAVAWHGYPRPTGDLDVWVRPTLENASRVVEALTAFGFGVASLNAAQFTTPEVVVRMGYVPNRIEIMSAVSGVSFEDCWPGRVQSTWDGVPVTVIGLDCLHKNKRASGRLKDLADLEELPPGSDDA